jgi:hypothetical protein
MTSYRRISSRTLNRSVQNQENIVNFMTPIGRGNAQTYLSLTDPSNNSLIVSNGSVSSATASDNLKFDETTLTVAGNLAVTGTMASQTGIIAQSIQSKTQIANAYSLVLVKNTHYLSPTDGSNITVPLPSIASSTLGDVIIVEYKTAINNAAIHKYGTSGEFFMAGSSCYVPAAGALIVSVNTANGSTHDFLNLIGLTNAGPGIGTYVVFTFNGVKWRVEARCTSSGTGAAGGTSVFNTT